MSQNGTTVAIEQLGKSVLALGEQLRSQEPKLHQLGVGLPMETLAKLETIREGLDKLGNRIQEQEIELAQLRILVDTAELINSTLDLDTVLNSVMDEVISLMGAERGYIMLRNPQTNELEPRVTRWSEQMGGGSNDLIMSRTIVDRVVKTGEAIITTNAQEDERFAGQDSIIGFALRSIICVPLIFRDEIMGAVYCDNRFRDALFRQRERRLLTAFANQATIAIQNAQLFEQIKEALREITEFKVLLDNILASIASGVITTDTKGKITTYNEASQTILARPAQTTIGQHLTEALPWVSSYIQKDWELAQTELISQMIEVETEIPERGQVNLNFKLSPLQDNSNRTQGVAITIDDLTELKRRDSQLAAVRRYLPPAMVDNIRSIEQLALGGEKREVTVMFVEVRPFESFPSAMPPADLMESLNTYLTIGSEAIQHHLGLIDKFMGNEIMCIFNTQLNPQENHAWDAVQAALRMAANYRTLAMYGASDTVDQNSYYRVGIHTGVATLGNVGSIDRREFSAIGDTVNLAHRLLENSQPAQIIISQETLECCEPFLKEVSWLGIKELDAIQVKGRVKAARVYEIYDSGE